MRTSSVSVPASLISHPQHRRCRRTRPVPTAMHKYSAVGGLPELKEAVAAKTMRDSSYAEASQVLITNGGKHAVYNEALLNPGDEVLLPTPYWTTYPEPLRLRVASPSRSSPRRRAAFAPPSSNRPGGGHQGARRIAVEPERAIYPRDEIEAISRWAVDHGIWVICDEIYEHLVYGDNEHYSMATRPRHGDKVIILNGVAKTYDDRLACRLDDRSC